MGQTAVELPDPLDAPLAPAGGADDLLSQLAGQEIDRLLTHADVDRDLDDAVEPETKSESDNKTRTEAETEVAKTPDAAVEVSSIDSVDDLMPVGAALESDPVITAELDDAFERSIGENGAGVSASASASASAFPPDPKAPAITSAGAADVGDAARAPDTAIVVPGEDKPATPAAAGELDDLLSQMAAADVAKEAIAAAAPDATVAAAPVESTSSTPVASGALDDLLSQMATADAVKEAGETSGATSSAAATEPPPPAQPAVEAPIAPAEAAPAAAPDAPMSPAALEIAAELEKSQAEGNPLSVAPPDAAPPAGAPEPAPLATGDIVTIGYESASLGHAPASGRLIRILEWINAPLSRSELLRDAVGKVAIMTLINAIAILIYVKFIRHEPASAASAAPDKGQVHSPPDHETAR